MKELRLFIGMLMLSSAIQLQAQLPKGSLTGKQAQDFEYYLKMAMDGKAIPDEKAAAPFKQFLKQMQSSSDLKTDLDSYFKGHNEEALEWLKKKKVPVQTDSADGMTQFVALRALYNKYNQRNSKPASYDGSVEVHIYAGPAAANHLKVISADAASKLGYDKVQKIGTAPKMMEAPEGWESFEQGDETDKEVEYVFTMKDGSEQTLTLPSSAQEVYTNSIKRSTKRKVGSDGSRSTHRETRYEYGKFSGFYIPQADIESDLNNRFVIVTDKDEHQHVNDLGDLTKARKIYVDSAEAATSAIEKLSKLKAEGKISFKDSQVEDLFGLELPGSPKSCLAVEA